jgi:hypothetical protein
MLIYNRTDEITSPLIRKLNAYWLGLAGGDIPDRDLLDLVAIKELRPSLMIADVEPTPLRIRFRLVGTRVVEATGIDFTGRYLDEIRPPAPGEVWMDEFRIAYEKRAPLFGMAKVATKYDWIYNYEFSIFPLRKGGDAIAQFLSLEDYFGLSSVKQDLPPWKFEG